MAEHDVTIYSTRQRWRDAGTISCFTWPLNEVVSVKLVKSGVGAIVHQKGEMPSWRSRIARGLNATTVLDAENTTLEYVPGWIYIGKWCGGGVQRYGHYSYDGDLFTGHTSVWTRPSAAPTVLDNQTRDEALMRALKDAREKQNHFRGGNFLAELRDTIRGLRNPAKGFRDLLDTYSRNAKRRVRRAMRRSPPVSQHEWRKLERAAPNVARAGQRALSDSWLEANFGWQPLLSDAVDAYHALRRLALRVPLERFYGASSREDAPSYASSSLNHQITRLDWTVSTRYTYSCKFYGAVKVQTESPPHSQAIEEMGVRARDFLPAVWEAIPFSFLIDYFTNIGEVIEAVSFPRSDLAWISRTYRNHSIRSTEQVAVKVPSDPAFPAGNSNVVWAFIPPRVVWDRSFVNRTSYSDSIIPSLRFEIPGARNWKKWANIAALARLRTL